MNATLTIRIQFETKVKLEGLATISRQPLGSVVEKAVDMMVEQLGKEQRLTLESLTEHATENAARPVAATPAGIWKVVNSQFIATARKRGQDRFLIRVADFHKSLGLVDRHTQVIQAFRSAVFHERYGVRLIQESEGKGKTFTFRLTSVPY